jgi:hypothetical protein
VRFVVDKGTGFFQVSRFSSVNYHYINSLNSPTYKQTELAFTLAKNATKPNPFEIIPLQATRKEYNWKTEETLVRAVVTLEMEWIKGSNS